MDWICNLKGRNVTTNVNKNKFSKMIHFKTFLVARFVLREKYITLEKFRCPLNFTQLHFAPSRLTCSMAW